MTGTTDTSPCTGTTGQTQHGWLLPTPVGRFELEPLRPLRDLPHLRTWMNDPEIAEYWNLNGPPERLDRHLTDQLTSPHSTPFLGRLDGHAMSYWEIYRADLDPLSAAYPARPHDAGIHLLIGSCALRGRGIGTALLHAVTEWALARSLWATRVVAEPDVRNSRSIRAFTSAGYHRQGVVDLPDKQAMLMMYDRNPLPARREAG